MAEQKLFWIAVLENDTVIKEFNPDGSENLYDDLPREQIKAFGLKSANASYFIDLETGVFHVKDHRGDKNLVIELPLDSRTVRLMFCKSEEKYPYKFFQFKKAHQDSLNGGALGDTVIDGHILGWHIMRDNQGDPLIATAQLNIDPYQVPTQATLTATLKKVANGKTLGTPYSLKI